MELVVACIVACHVVGTGRLTHFMIEAIDVAENLR
jgi:hypothetical protein